MSSDFSLRKGCNRYQTAHCYLVEPKDFELVPSFLEGNQVGGAVNFVSLNPSELATLVARIDAGTLRVDLPNDSTYEFEGTENESGGLDFRIDPVIPIEAANAGKWRFTWQPTFQTVSNLNCSDRGFSIETDIGTEEPNTTE